MKRLTLALALVWFFADIGMAATVYKWVDENGTVHYGQRPKDKSSKRMKIRVKQPSTPAASSTSTAPKTGSTQASNSTGEAKKSAEELAWEKKQTEIKQKNCEMARERMASLTAGGRMYEVKDGQRHYLDDAARSAKMKDARESVNKWCN